MPPPRPLSSLKLGKAPNRRLRGFDRGVSAQSAVTMPRNLWVPIEEDAGCWQAPCRPLPGRSEMAACGRANRVGCEHKCPPGLATECEVLKIRWSASRPFQIGARFVTGPIERLGRRGVKASMDCVRTVLCSLLPALWVLAVGHCLADPVSGCPEGCDRTSVSATEGSSHAPLTDVRSFEQSARLLKRRMGMQTGWGGLLVPAAVSASGLGELEHISVPLTVFTDALGLARCWQFYWRAASEPRAPSSVS
jgi:hypothetical protein